VIKGWNAEALADDDALAKWLPGRGTRLLVLIVYHDEWCRFTAVDTFSLPREDIRVMLNDPGVRDRTAKEAREVGATDAVCLVTLAPMEVDDFMTVRRGTGRHELPVSNFGGSTIRAKRPETSSPRRSYGRVRSPSP
jgi:hypothetical protein